MDRWIFFSEGQIYTKNGDFWGVGPDFKSQNSGIWCQGADLGLPLPTKYYKNCLRGYTLLGKFIPKITNFGDFVGYSPHFKSDNG